MAAGCGSHPHASMVKGRWNRLLGGTRLLAAAAMGALIARSSLLVGGLLWLELVTLAIELKGAVCNFTSINHVFIAHI